jgi:hypothetical protein
MKSQSILFVILALFFLTFAACSSGGGGTSDSAIADSETSNESATNSDSGTEETADDSSEDVSSDDEGNATAGYDTAETGDASLSGETASDDSVNDSDDTGEDALDSDEGTFVDPDSETDSGSGGTDGDSSGEDQSADGSEETETDPEPDAGRTYVVVDTGQESCFDDASYIGCPSAGTAFSGQDAQYAGPAPRYADNGDGTITDENTGLMWQQDPGEKMTWDEAMAGAGDFALAGYGDWRMPTIKELYSLMDFSGETGMSAAESVPYLDDRYFVFQYGDESAGERFIDSQFASATKYVSTPMNGDETVFGVNFADGRIKGYGTANPQGGEKGFFVLYVRGNTDYGVNRFVDNGDGTITDEATGLTWMQFDSGDFLAGENGDGGLTWEAALEWAESLEYAGYDDWRLPNAKELQSIVDYARSPDTTGGPAIDPLFHSTAIVDEGGALNWPFYWTGTTHKDGRNYGEAAAYVAFGEALGFMEMPPNSGNYTLMDVHGAGAQRSDPKIGDPADYPNGFGPQGDVRRIYNHVRCVRCGLGNGMD